MSYLQGYTPTASGVVPSRLQSRDLEIPSPSSAPPYTPLDYDPSQYQHPPDGCCHDCVHPTCEERFAALESRMNEYCKRSECRCGQSTWCRTKSFFKRIKSLRKTQCPPEKEQGRDPNRTNDVSSAQGKNTPAVQELPGSPPRAELNGDINFHGYELPSLQVPVELLGGISFHYYELPVTQLSSAFHSMTPQYPTLQLANHYPSLYDPHGNPNAGYNLNTAAPTPTAYYQPQERVQPVLELDAGLRYPVQHVAASYPRTPAGSFSAISSLSQSTASASPFFVSPQSSISSVNTTLSTTANSVDTTNNGGPLFAACTTYSPVEYGADDDMAPWGKQGVASHQGSWDSTTTLAEHAEHAELPGSTPEDVPGTGQWPQAPEPVGIATVSAQLQTSLPVSPYSIPLPSQPTGHTTTRIGGGGTQEAPEAAPSLIPAVPSAYHKNLTDMGKLEQTFSWVRRDPVWEGMGVGLPPELSDQDAVLAGISELEKVRQNQVGNSVLDKTCFAHLVLSMAIERDAIPRGLAESFQREATEFLRGGCSFAVPDSFLAISTDFLYALHAQIDAAGDLWPLLRGPDEERRPTMLALEFMRSHFQSQAHPPRRRPQRPALQSRGNSWDSTASTALDLGLAEPDETTDALAAPPLVDAISALPSQQRTMGEKRTVLERAQNQAVCCEPCGFYPAEGNDQRKKLEKHKRTNRHRKNTNQHTTEVERFPCPICGKSYNRGDNMRQHLKTHGAQGSAERTTTRGRKKLVR